MCFGRDDLKRSRQQHILRIIFFNIIQYENVLFAYLYGRRENFLVKKKNAIRFYNKLF